MATLRKRLSEPAVVTLREEEHGSGSSRLARRAKSSRKTAPARKNSRNGTGPGWSRMSTKVGSVGRPRRVSSLDAVSTLRFALLVLAVATAFTFYVGHVHDMQELLVDLQYEQRENLRLHLKYNRLKGDFDRATGPAIIYERARAMGLQEGIEYGPTIVIE